MRRTFAFVAILTFTVCVNAADIYHAKQGEVLILDAVELCGEDVPPDGITISVFGRKIEPIIFENSRYFIIGVDFRTMPDKYDFLVCNGADQIAKKELVVEAEKFPTVKMNSGRQKLSEPTQKRIAEEKAAVENLICSDFIVLQKTAADDFGKWSYPLPKPELTASGGGFGAARIWKDGVSKHAGVDLRAKYVKTYAVADGTVVMAIKYPQKPFLMHGYMVIVRHAGGLLSLYAHLSKVYVSDTQKVRSGEALGVTGETGNARGPHLHFGIIVDCASVDPLAAIKKFQEFFK